MSRLSDLDRLDLKILRTMRSNPRVSVLSLAQICGVARNTVYARLERLQSTGVITGFGPEIDVTALGFPVLALTTIQVVQGRFGDVVSALREMDAVLEVHTVAGDADLFCKVAALSNQDLMETIREILALPGVDRTNTSIAMEQSVPYRTDGLITLLEERDV